MASEIDPEHWKCPIFAGLSFFLFSRYADFYAKKLLILDTVAGNSVTPWTLLLNIYVSQIFFYNCSTAEVLYSIWAVVWSGYQALRPVCSCLYHHKEVSLGTECQKVRDYNTSSDIIFIDNSVKLILKLRILLKVPNCKYLHPRVVIHTTFSRIPHIPI